MSVKRPTKVHFEKITAEISKIAPITPAITLWARFESFSNPNIKILPRFRFFQEFVDTTISVLPYHFPKE